MTTAVALDSCTLTAGPPSGAVTSRSARAPAVSVTERPDTSVGRCTSVPSTASSRYEPLLQIFMGPLSVLVTRTLSRWPGCAGTRKILRLAVDGPKTAISMRDRRDLTGWAMPDLGATTSDPSNPPATWGLETW
jgi:hypothetical protein